MPKCMSSEFEVKLEQQIDRELHRLPDVPAPLTLILRVRAAMAAADQRPWWRRPWLTWPVPIQAVSALLLAAGMAAVAYGCAGAWEAIVASSYAQQTGRWIGVLALVADSFVALGRAMVLGGQSVGQPVLIYGLVICFALYATCIGLGTVFYRLVWHRR